MTASAQSFGGTIRLYGRPAFDQFQSSHVMVIGLGGVGSWTVEALARSGVGKFTLVDLDEICVTNINRQLPATSATIGKLKAEVLAQRVREINPDAEVQVEPIYFTESTANRLLAAPPDIIVDAIDSQFQKAHLLAHCWKESIPVVSSGSSGGKVDPSRIQMADITRAHHDRLLMVVRKRLRTHYNFPRDVKRSFGIECVFSDEIVQWPAENPAVCTTTSEKAADDTHNATRSLGQGEVDTRSPTRSSGQGEDNPGNMRGNCDGGLGSSAAVTGSFGFALAGLVLKHLAALNAPT